mmetsp:Transcript_16916/g.34301  ORF Transcript_16916/g.34301 Transcript_16916/m.34301 type:complete len:166 (-) Transcript_16916:2-499(-)
MPVIHPSLHANCLLSSSHFVFSSSQFNMADETRHPDANHPHPHVFYNNPTDRPFQNNLFPLAQPGSTNPGPMGKCTFVIPNGIAKSFFTPFAPAAFPLKVLPLGYKVTDARDFDTIPNLLTCPPAIGTRYTTLGGGPPPAAPLVVWGRSTSNSTYRPYNLLMQSS